MFYFLNLEVLNTFIKCHFIKLTHCFYLLFKKLCFKMFFHYFSSAYSYMGCLPSRLSLIHISCPGTFLYHFRVSFQSVLFWMQDFLPSFVVFVCFETKFLSLWNPDGPETQSCLPLSSLSAEILQVWPVILDSPCFSSVRWSTSYKGFLIIDKYLEIWWISYLFHYKNWS